MNIGHNDSQQRVVRFKLWMNSLQQLVTISDSIVFEPLEFKGSLHAPVVLNVTGVTGISEVKDDLPIISQAWPNPAQHTINLSIRTKERAVASLVLSDQLGRTVMVKEFLLISGSNDLRMNVSEIRPGLYQLISTVTGETGQQRKVQSIIVK